MWHSAKYIWHLSRLPIPIFLMNVVVAFIDSLGEKLGISLAEIVVRILLLWVILLMNMMVYAIQVFMLPLWRYLRILSKQILGRYRISMHTYG